MSDDIHFTEFPPWEAMNFSTSCQVWGECSSLDVYASLKITGENGTSVGLYDAFIKFLLSDPGNSWETERCIAIGWSGDMDLIGIGMFTSYYVEAVLVTILLFAYSYWRFRQPFPSYKNPAPNTSKSRRRYRFVVGLQELLQNFLDASELFSIAMLVAALYLSGKGIVQRKDFDNPDATTNVPPKIALYDMLLSMLASTFSIFPVIIAYTIQRRHPSDSMNHKHRPTWFGVAILLLIWVLSVMEAFMSLYGNLDYKYGEIGGFVFNPCTYAS
ncbi:hypothetical protein F5883DRAFT_693296 [Diaporthe sp. PMI_573]|nr:hypothetical protein F5883DRAFT_693296 [Diaporthaceae sp. PMI_573]